MNKIILFNVYMLRATVISLMLFSISAFAEDFDVLMGQASLLRLNESVVRVSVADTKIVDVTVMNPRELYVLGKMPGKTNLILWSKGGGTLIKEVNVNLDLSVLKASIKRALPSENLLDISTTSGSVVLSGAVSDVIAADTVVSLTNAYIQQFKPGMNGGQLGTNSDASQTSQSSNNPAMTGVSVINLLRIKDPQQVMLEVKIAEISKNLLEKLGVNLYGETSGAGKWGIASGFSLDGQGVLNIGNRLGAKIDAQKDDALVKVLAEPTIVAMSGQEGSFLVGGKIYIPQTGALGNVTLLEVPFGIGLRFVPTVLDKGRVNLKVAPEVSEIVDQTTLRTGAGTFTTIIPRISTKQASTTVQLRDGQSLVIGGLLSDNVVETIKAFPILGELPVIGALFRSKQFDSKKTELIVVVTPRLVAATDSQPLMPTDRYTPPSRSGFFLGNETGLDSNPSSTEER